MNNSKQLEFNYKNTLNLPTTNFPMKANLVIEEPKILEFWEKVDLYSQLQQIHKHDPIFAFQDGPPYANGDLHLGHAFNKILKDFVVKIKNLSGFKVPFIPGWDCHGLPIEIQVEKKLGLQSHQLDKTIFIAKCREYANSQVNNQKQQFIRLGVIADWQNPYLTMDFKFQAAVIRQLAKILANGSIIRGDRPVHWCLNCGSALAEAEVEYKEKTSTSIYVAFDGINNPEILKIFSIESPQKFNSLSYSDLLNTKISVLIWTTTPWTIPAIYGISINKNFNYSLVYCYKLQRSYIIANELISTVLAALEIVEYIVLGTCVGAKLEYLEVMHPIYHDRILPVILGKHVTLTAGTGCVTTAPAHGADDYIVGKKYKLPIVNFINSRGIFLETSKFFTGSHINQAAEQILLKLTENQSLLAVNQISHSYPHCWRHKTPIISMATPQWFISMEQAELRSQALTAIQKVNWIPASGKTRMESMLGIGRPDWCISRQRTWGVPIPFFLNKTTQELHPQQLELMEKIAQLVEVGGIEAWHNLDLDQFLGTEANNYIKSNDILDVWFESGTVSSCMAEISPGSAKSENLYLEGSDQHRGWFQSSLLISMAVHHLPPYNTVLTHGFILDKDGNKMSKSLGNIILPKDVINKYGADLLRLWVATTDYTSDLKISEEILTRVSEAYRRIRNTARFLLANLYDFDPTSDLIPASSMLLLDRKILQLTIELQQKIQKDYDEYKFHLAYQKILNFCVEELGSFYLDLIKDRQYTCPKNSIPRRSAQTVLYYVLEGLVRWISPILSFTAEEIWRHMPDRKQISVFLSSWQQDWPSVNNLHTFPEDFWETIFMVKKEVNKHIEIARNNGLIGSNLEAEIVIDCDQKIYQVLAQLQPELKFLLITAEVTINLLNIENQFQIHLNRSNHAKCTRCWHRVAIINDVGLCDRCNLNLNSEIGEVRKYV